MISKSIAQNELSRIALATEAARLQRLAQMISEGAQTVAGLKEPISVQPDAAPADPAKGTSIDRTV